MIAGPAFSRERPYGTCPQRDWRRSADQKTTRSLQDKIFNALRESFLIHASCYVGRRLFNFFTGLSHRDGVSALFEHQDIVWHVSDRGKLGWRYLQEIGQHFDDGSLVGFRVRDIKIVGPG